MTFEKKEETLKQLSKVLRHSIFPVNVDINNLKDHVIYQGLTKREYFAAMAMQGYIASGLMDRAGEATVAMHSVTAADALIAALYE
jgi:hypothetical protein